MLAVSGQLNPKAGGPSVMVPIDKGLVNPLYKPSQWVPAKDPAEYNRRSVYLLVKRNLRAAVHAGVRRAGRLGELRRAANRARTRRRRWRC